MKKSLVDRIAEGEAILLGVDDICKRIGVSRTTFDRWVRNGGGNPSNLNSSVFGNTGTRLSDLASNMSDSNITFPAPDIRIGNSPRWEIETFKEWLRLNVTNKKT
jgi:predicted DNA-binding transcriptional regulator AlpA